jgi:hypothetical protein
VKIHYPASAIPSRTLLFIGTCLAVIAFGLVALLWR